MRRIGIRFWLLNKRFFKTYSFLLILCLVPVLVAGVRLGAREDSGIAKILLYLPDPEDEPAFQIASGLMENNSVLYYELCDSEEEGRKAVEGFQADALWVFPENMSEALAEVVSGVSRKSHIVTIVQREDDVRMLFTRQILCAELYPAFSYEMYVNFVRNKCGLPDVTDEELQEAYNSTLMEGSLFRMEYLDGESAEEDGDYLLAPIRGILALWLVVCGFAGAIYYMQDEQRGVFSGLPVKRRLFWAFGVQGVLLCDGVAVMLAALKIAGVFTTWGREILAAVLFACCVLMFCNLIRLLCRRPEQLVSIIPLLLTGMLILCPVFLDVNGPKSLQYLLPPYYYLKSVHAGFYLGGMACYSAALAVVCFLLYHRQCRHIKE